jgi:nitroreductase
VSDPPRSGPSSPVAGRTSAPAFARARAEALEDAADHARLAPSIHNTQPWILVLGEDRLTVRADRSRELTSLDPTGRSLVLSVGAALFNARAALAGRGWAVEVARLPRRDDPDLLAEVRPLPGRPDSQLALLDEVITRRRTNRRRFTPEPVPRDVLARLRGLATREMTTLVVVRTEAHRRLVARLTQEADRMQNGDPAYRAERRRWTTRPASAGDGVPARAVPRVNSGWSDQLRPRDFDTAGAGELPAETGPAPDPTVALLVTRNDDAMAWLRAGEAFERLLLELTRLGWAAAPVTQAVEVPLIRTQLRSALAWNAHPQALLRIGHAPGTPSAPRRPRDEVVRNSGRSPDPLYVRQPPGSPAAAHRRPVSDGRGGTIDTDVI